MAKEEEGSNRQGGRKDDCAAKKKMKVTSKPAKKQTCGGNGGAKPIGWAKSEGKKILQKELANVNSSYHGMSINEVHQSNPHFSVYPIKNFTTNYKNLLKKIETDKQGSGKKKKDTTSKPTKKQTHHSAAKSATNLSSNINGNVGGAKLVGWAKSEGKKILQKELANVNSSYHGMSINEVHQSNPHFSVYPIKNFTTNYKNLSKKIETNKIRAEFDNKAVSEHKTKFPRKPNTKGGYPHWNGHNAKELLEKDVRDGTVNEMPPRELRKIREPYTEFPVKIFGKRVHSERRKQREASFWVDKRNRKALKKHMKEVAERKKEEML